MPQPQSQKLHLPLISQVDVFTVHMADAMAPCEVGTGREPGAAMKEKRSILKSVLKYYKESTRTLGDIT